MILRKHKTKSNPKWNRFFKRCESNSKKIVSKNTEEKSVFPKNYVMQKSRNLILTNTTENNRTPNKRLPPLRSQSRNEGIRDNFNTSLSIKKFRMSPSGFQYQKVYKKLVRIMTPFSDLYIK